MASATRAALLPARPLAGYPGAVRAPAAPAAGGGRAALLPTAPTEALPVPLLQIRSFSGAGRAAWAGEAAGRGCLPGLGGGLPTPAAGPLSTSNYLRLRFGAPLPAAVLAAAPELWLFAGADCPDCANCPSAAPACASACPGGAALAGAGAAGPQRLALAHPHTDLVLDANHWFGDRPGQLRPGPGAWRFRFALVVDAPAGAPTPSGKHRGPLSREVWLGYRPPGAGPGCAFQLPVGGGRQHAAWRAA